MYKISDIRGIHLETSSKCQARCPQCTRFSFDYEDGKMKINPLITDRNGKSGKLDEISFLDFVRWFPPKFVSQLNYLYMCGTFGDPIFATDCAKILAYLRTYNPKINLSIHTNGGFRSKEWWEKIAKLNVKVIFGIDGLEDTHSLYRVNVNWKQVIENARSFIRAGGNAEWQMIVFKHNEHQITKCMKLAKLLGFKSFYYQHTTRFGENGGKNQPVVNPKGEVTHYLEPSSISLKSFDKIKYSYFESSSVEETIDCSAKKSREIYVAANGTIVPCCHMMSCFLYENDDIEDYKTKINVYPNLHKQNLKEIFDSLYFAKIEKTWNNNPLLVCSKVCGKNTGTWRENNSNQTKFITF
jgi:sulfatase maturation enzyme AslB (radical SAM superfamily)